MRFSQLDVIEKERELLAMRKSEANAGLIGKIFGTIINAKEPKYTFQFRVPQYFFIRSLSFCRDVADEIENVFGVDDLAEILYIDFLEYIQGSNDVQGAYKKLCSRELLGIREENARARKKDKDNETIRVRLDHRDALKGEFLLHDMLELFPEHNFTLENILEIVFCDFVDNYRKGLIKNPIDKITQYVV